MRDGSYIADLGDTKTYGLQSPDRSVTAGSRACGLDLNLAHAMIHSLLGGSFSRILGCEGSTLS